MKKSTIRTFLIVVAIVLVIVCFPAILECIAVILLALLHGVAAALLAMLVAGIIVTLLECLFDVKLTKAEEGEPASASWKF